MTKSDTTNALRNAVFVAARSHFKAQLVVVDAIKACKLDWTDETAVESIASAYKAGRLCGALALKNEAAAQAIFALKPHKDGEGSDGRRTFAEHLACRAAISAWSSIRMLSGAPSAQTGKTRAPRQTVAAPESDKNTDSDIAPAMLAVPRADKPADVHAFALRMADVFTKYLNRNAKLVTGDLGTLMRSYVDGVRGFDKHADVAKAVAKANKRKIVITTAPAANTLAA